MICNRLLTAMGAAGLFASVSSSALAIPALQLFIEGADFETKDENSVDDATWAKLGTSSFRLWVIGGSDEGLGKLGHIDATHRIHDVKLVASFDDSLLPTSATTDALKLNFASSLLSFSPDQDNNAHGFNDLTTPSAPSGPAGSPFPAIGGTDAEYWSTPTGPMGGHGMLSPGRTAIEWNLGDFTEYLTTFTADFAPFPDTGNAVEASDNWFPTGTFSHKGQINVYNVTISGLPVGAQVHFDAYGTAQELKECKDDDITGCTQDPTDLKYYKWKDAKPGNLALVNAPFSHDARWEQARKVPTPATAALLLGGLGGLGWFARRRKTA